MKLFNRNFTLVMIGQIISLFGNATLRFALPLYLLDATGSASLFGIVLACSFIPMVLLSPIGGLLADRVNKRNIMVILDFVTAVLTLLFLLTMGKLSAEGLICVMMLLLSAIQAVYQPSVQASIPFLQEKHNLMTANAIINQIMSLANLIGPVIGGVVYGVFGLIPVVIVSAICFLFSAIMELFIHIPGNKKAASGSIFSIARQDLGESLSYIRIDKPIIMKVIFIVSLFNLFLSSLIIVGTPVMIKVHLSLSSQLYGYAQGISAAGGLLGGVLIGVLAKKMQLQNAWKLLLGTAILLLPIALVLFFQTPALPAYLVIVACNFLMMMLATMFTVQMLSFIQGEVPGELIGKVISFAMALSMCSQPIGQALYGVLFDAAAHIPFLIFLCGSIISAVISFRSRAIFHRL